MSANYSIAISRDQGKDGDQYWGEVFAISVAEPVFVTSFCATAKQAEAECDAWVFKRELSPGAHRRVNELAQAMRLTGGAAPAVYYVAEKLIDLGCQIQSGEAANL